MSGFQLAFSLFFLVFDYHVYRDVKYTFHTGKLLQSIRKLNLFSYSRPDIFRECYDFPSSVPRDALLAILRTPGSSPFRVIFRPIWACHVIDFLGQTCMCFQWIHVPRKTVGPRWSACGFPTSFFSFMRDDCYVMQTQVPASEGASCFSPPVLNQGHSLTHSFSQERFLEYPLFPKSHEGSTENRNLSLATMHI